ncbi:hypothetical protein WR25_00205 [Diploscapter pachys]|uniref:Uncharacterized protein n=1 Tax=Diploscapter pachys TaxID=2018661 RepID=A0A2A2J4G5_9BILA|nr:hypothetical protein WR25_00205 [Diploscapter pachys]
MLIFPFLLLYSDENSEPFIPETILYDYKIHLRNKETREVVFSMPNPCSEFLDEYRQKSAYHINPILKLTNSPEKSDYFSLIPKKVNIFSTFQTIDQRILL